MKPNYRTLNSPLDAATLCRKNGWSAGTVVRGTEGKGKDWEHTCDLLITAVGESTILGRCLTCGSGHEGCWGLSCREWEELKPRAVAATQSLE